MRARLLLLTAITALLVAACGSGGDSISADAEEFAFSPTSWTITEGAEVTLTLTNNGTEEHEWVILSEEITAEDQFTEDLVIWEMEAEPGVAAQGSFTAPAAGTYQVICALDGHFSSGMAGTLTVEEG